MGKEKFEMFNKSLILDTKNDNILNIYQAMLRLNEFNNRVEKLEQELTELKEKMQEEISRREIYFISWLNNQICKGYVCAYDEENKFTIICGEYMITADEIFTFEEQAIEKLKEMQGNE